MRCNNEIIYVLTVQDIKGDHHDILDPQLSKSCSPFPTCAFPNFKEQILQLAVLICVYIGSVMYGNKLLLLFSKKDY